MSQFTYRRATARPCSAPRRRAYPGTGSRHWLRHRRERPLLRQSRNRRHRPRRVRRRITRAQAKARRRGLSARFIEGDALQLAALGEMFDTVTDSGLLHVFSDQEMQQVIRGIHAVLRPSGRYWLMCFSEHATLPGPRRLTKQLIATLFKDGWQIRSIEQAQFKVRRGCARRSVGDVAIDSDCFSKAIRRQPRAIATLREKKNPGTVTKRLSGCLSVTRYEHPIFRW